jgi:hypothetical protein
MLFGRAGSESKQSSHSQAGRHVVNDLIWRFRLTQLPAAVDQHCRVAVSRGDLYLRWTVQKNPGCIFWTVQKKPGCMRCTVQKNPGCILSDVDGWLGNGLEW